MSGIKVDLENNGDTGNAVSDKMDGIESSHTEHAILSTDRDSLPRGYFTSPFFLGTMVASGFAIAGVSAMIYHSGRFLKRKLTICYRGQGALLSRRRF